MAATNVPKDKATRRRRNTPERGDWKPAPGVGWQHGTMPDPPPGLSEATRAEWRGWFRAWYAAYWTVDDLHGLRMIARIHSAVIQGDLTRVAELRKWMDTFGLTPEGQAKRRWTRFAPAAGEAAKPAPAKDTPASMPSSPYGHLRVAK